MKTIKVNNSPLDLETREKELQEECKLSIEFWNKASNAIKRVEKNLQESFPNITFITPHPIHSELLEINLDFESSSKKMDWFLAWDRYGKTNKYRLLLIKEETKTMYILEENNKPLTDLPSKCMLKKPVIEVEIKSRLRCYQNLDRFVFLFKNHLEKLRKTELTSGDLTFKNI